VGGSDLGEQLFIVAKLQANVLVKRHLTPLTSRSMFFSLA
jgi:hypothetical protein|tara:strand:- start:355 stop:474 length:120 start_codon:yes stop_codon:yes gene_type:complete